MTNFQVSYLVDFGLDLPTPGLKSDYKSAVLPTALPGPANMYACKFMSAHMRACLSACVQMDRG